MNSIVFASAGVGQYIFIGAFVVILTAIALTLMLAAWRTRRALRKAPVEKIGWEGAFEDLPEPARACRHAFTGERPGRICKHGFDCRECEGHEALCAQRCPHETDVAAGDLSATQTATAVAGMELPGDRLYHRGHTWVRKADDGTLEVGLDPFGVRLLGLPEQLRLPEPGERLFVNGPAFRVRRGGATARVLSPVDGTVVETGGPEAGWYLRVKPDAPEPNLKHLLDAHEAQAWLRADLERLHGLLAPTPLGASLQDGGELADDLPRALPTADWDAVWAEFFLEP